MKKYIEYGQLVYFSVNYFCAIFSFNLANAMAIHKMPKNHSNQFIVYLHIYNLCILNADISKNWEVYFCKIYFEVFPNMSTKRRHPLSRNIFSRHKSWRRLMYEFKDKFIVRSQVCQIPTTIYSWEYIRRRVYQTLYAQRTLPTSFSSYKCSNNLSNAVLGSYIFSGLRNFRSFCQGINANNSYEPSSLITDHSD